VAREHGVQNDNDPSTWVVYTDP